MEDKSKKQSTEFYLLKALDELEKKKLFTWTIFLLCAVASLINAMNSVSYVFMAEVYIVLN